MKFLIAHLVADCFYISAERVRDRFLLGKPVGVLGNQGACVIAKSYELKARGVKTGEPIWDAVKKCPEAVFIKRDFEWYEVVSRQMLGIVRHWSPEVEYCSIDEFFFSVRSEDPLSFAQRVSRFGVAPKLEDGDNPCCDPQHNRFHRSIVVLRQNRYERNSGTCP